VVGNVVEQITNPTTEMIEAEEERLKQREAAKNARQTEAKEHEQKAEHKEKKAKEQSA
jgi:hypothetical protein